MSTARHATMQRYLALLESGELERLRMGASSSAEWAARCGMTDGQMRAVRLRAEQAGWVVPKWIGSQPDVPSAETCGGLTGVATDIGDDGELDFDDEEPTVRVDAYQQESRTSGIREPFTRHLTREDVPDGSVIAVLSDIHIPYHDADAVRLAIECCEFAGADIVILNGDIADCGPSSRHEAKRRREILQWGSTQRSIEPGLWIYEWARTKQCFLLRGNHEAWVENEIKESPTMNEATPESLMGLPEDGAGWEVLPDMSRLRLGNRVWCHGSNFFKTGSPGANPGARLKSKAPDQTTSVGHCHIKHATYWTTEDEHGVLRTRAGFFNGHLSRPEAHVEYAGTNLNWQQSFEITRVWWHDDRPRFTTDQPEIHRDRYGKPIFEYQGKIFGGKRA